MPRRKERAPSVVALIATPGTKLPCLPVWRWPYEHVGAEVIALVPNATLFGSKYVPDEELYLRELMDLNLADADAIAAFCTEYGPLYDPLDEGGRRDLLPPATCDADDFRSDAVLLRDMTRLVLTLSEAAVYGESDFESGSLFYQVVSTALGTWGALTLLNRGLQAWTPRLQVIESGKALDVPTERNCTLYEAICRQLYNAVVEKPAYRRCAKCNRLFVNQRGRSEYGDHRPPELVKYCSKRCAVNAAKRTYRESRKASRPNAGKKQGGHNGTHA